MIWQNFGRFILRNRFWLLISLGVFTLIFIILASQVQLSYDMGRVVPKDDADWIDYTKFKETFGEDGNILVVGIQSDKLFERDYFNDFYELCNSIEKTEGVQKVVSIPKIYKLYRDDDLHELQLKPLLNHYLETQEEADSFKQQVLNLPFYKGLLYNEEDNVALIAITLTKEKLNSKERIPLVQNLELLCNEFGKDHETEIYYSGLPYVRTIMATKVKDEIKIFTILSIIITAVFIFIFFKFFSAVFFSLIVVGAAVVCTFGTVYALGYRINLLTGVLPPLMVIIGIQNCIYLLNVYHQEFRTHGNKMLAIVRLISKNGLPLFLTNVTTAVGFCVFSFSGSAILDEFSIVSGINIMLVYLISLIFIPIVYSYLPPPKYEHTKHLDGYRLNRVMERCNYLVYNHRKKIYAATIIICALSVWGATRVQTLGYVVDDLPVRDKVYTDLKFFEKHFKGVLPYEISINTKRKNGVKDLTTLQKINRLQKELSEFPEFSKSVAITDFLKFANQAYNGGDPRYSIIPNALEIPELMSYMPKTSSSNGSLIKSMVDSNYQTARISVQMADVGSVEMKNLNAKVQTLVNEIFPKEKYQVKLTGTSFIFLKGNDYLVENLLQSVISALIIISVMMAFLFTSWRMVLISLLPNIVPLLMTIGIMGFFDIRLKPSTIIIFSVAYGIVVDFTIHYLAKYRNSLKHNDWDMQRAIPESLSEAGPSIIYTAVALFFGFIIFAFSDFGGTIALGTLTSLSLLFGMFMNLLLLPSLLLSLEKSINAKKEFSKTLIEMEE